MLNVFHMLVNMDAVSVTFNLISYNGVNNICLCLFKPHLGLKPPFN